jgi:hypothetical protein
MLNYFHAQLISSPSVIKDLSFIRAILNPVGIHEQNGQTITVRIF